MWNYAAKINNFISALPYLLMTTYYYVNRMDLDGDRFQRILTSSYTYGLDFDYRYHYDNVPKVHPWVMHCILSAQREVGLTLGLGLSMGVWLKLGNEYIVALSLQI